MNADTLGQIANALERIESHLAVIARLLAARQGVTMTVLPNGQTVIGDVRPVDTQVPSR